MPPDYKDRVQRQADEMKKEFGAKLALDQSQLASQAENELRFNQRVQDVQAGGAPVATGVLPIRVQIPTSGELYRFAETLVSGEPMTLRLTYVAGGLKRLVLALFLAAVALAIYLFLRRSPEEPWPRGSRFCLGVKSRGPRGRDRDSARVFPALRVLPLGPPVCIPMLFRQP